MKQKILGSNDILVDDYNATAIANMVNDSNATADSDGQKYLRAGTMLTSTGDYLTSNDGSVVLEPTTDATKATGILRQDYNITEGAVPASVIVSGTINLARMDDETKKLYTAAAIDSLKTSLPKLVVINRN